MLVTVPGAVCNILNHGREERFAFPNIANTWERQNFSSRYILAICEGSI